MLFNTVLPDGINESLPKQAYQLEALRRDFIDLYQSWGYQLVITPMAEYLESLRTGSGSQLDLETFKITDQLNGRLMGVRADMTPQVARIDANRIARGDENKINRLCYIDSVLRTRSAQQGGSRSPIQVGAELFGHLGLESDLEIISLMISSFKHIDDAEYVLDLGHIGVVEGMVRFVGFSEEQERVYLDMLARKSLPEIKLFIEENNFSKDINSLLIQLPNLHGNKDIINNAKKVLACCDEKTLKAVDYLETLVSEILAHFPTLDIHLDLVELRGYAYHTGIIYGLYHPSEREAIANGGRYDGIGEKFGNARPATGFSSDLRSILNIAKQSNQYEIVSLETVYAPAEKDQGLEQAITALRDQGVQVIRLFDGQKIDSVNDNVLKKNSQNEWEIS